MSDVKPNGGETFREKEREREGEREINHDQKIEVNRAINLTFGISDPLAFVHMYSLIGHSA
jgi:hypothetical protein